MLPIAWWTITITALMFMYMWCWMWCMFLLKHETRYNFRYRTLTGVPHMLLHGVTWFWFVWFLASLITSAITSL